MKYLFSNDIYYMWKKNLKYYILLITILCTFPIFLRYALQIDFSENILQDIFFINLGVNYANFSPSEYTIFVISILFYSYLVLDLFSKDMCIGKENIFLRISISKWYYCKIIILSFYILMFATFQTIILGTIYVILGFKITTLYFVKILLLNIILKMILMFVNIIMLLLFPKMNHFMILIIYTFPWIVKCKILDILFINIYINNIWLLLPICLVLILILYRLRNKIILQFEGRIYDN